uniref:Glycosyltransferase N-terminal domain-containing protein n=1 Tax=Chenopodium quinoa TaxID=63459 RepID=A0A803MWX4_CHEQI
MNIQTKNIEHHQVVVVIVQLPAQGHLNQLLHLSNFITSYGIPVHYAGSTFHNRQAKIRFHGWNSKILTKIHFDDFELPPFDSPPPKIDDLFLHHVQPLLEAMMHLRQPVFHLMKQLSKIYKRVVIIYDNSMSYIFQDVKLIPNGEAYAFLPICAFTYFAMEWESMPEEAKPFRVDAIYVPNCMPSQEGCITKEMLEFLENFNKSSGFESGWLYNTSRVIDRKYVEFLGKMISLKKGDDVQNFELGPLNPVHIQSTSKNRHHSLEWLDAQEKDLILYVSFWTRILLKDDQIEELAKGLEICGKKFIWVLQQTDPNDIFVEADKVKKPQLPASFEERVKDIVKTLMASQEGKEIKKRAKELGEAVRGSVAKCGVSDLERDAFIAHISR